MCDSIEDGMEWVFALKRQQWLGAPTKVISIDEMVAAQVMVTISGMARIEEMYRSNRTPDEPILVIKVDEGYVIRDGHHRWTRAILHGTDFLEAKVLEDPRMSASQKIHAL